VAAFLFGRTTGASAIGVPGDGAATTSVCTSTGVLTSPVVSLFGSTIFDSGSGVDRAVIALWLRHEQVETTQMYLDANLAMKERALARTTPQGARAARFRPSDSLLDFLEGL
jgi:hypothetical protein